MKGNPQKKITFEDRFDRHYACWVRITEKHGIGLNGRIERNSDGL